MTYTVAVRALTEFTAKRGDLDLRFTPSPTALEGIAGHATVSARRAAGYQTELSLAGEYRHLLVRGRADGYDPAQNQLEEIKTCKGSPDSIPDNHRHLHWAQVKMYGWLLCEKQGLTELRLALVYFDISSQRETVLVERHTAQELRRHFEEQCERFLAWADQELAHRQARDAALAALRFPHASFRSGQRQLAEAVYRAAAGGRCLMAQAPTGIGKTIGTIFPLLKACPAQELDKVFFLTAKTSGRALALEALAQLRDSASAMPLRALELIARDKACEHPDKACHGESCPLAQSFYDRLPQARQAALARGMLDKAATRAVALEHGICPYYLGQELARWCDVVVGDYNYYFDSSALLHALTAENQWRAAVLADEAHNLLERARKMYSAELDQTSFHFMRQAAPAALKKSLERLGRAWNALHKEQEEPYQAYPEVPIKFAAVLQQVISAITDFLAENPTFVDNDLQRFYFDALQFSRLAESFGTHSLFDITKEQRGGYVRSVLCIRNIIPAPFLAPRFATARTATLFSATLSPWYFYRDTLGLPEDTACIEVESPFSAQQLTVKIAGHISTRYRDRSGSLASIVALLARRYRERPGNYLAFFSSFDYLHNAAQLFRASHPDIPTWEQARRMAEPEREQFLARFAPDGRGIGFAVLGGAFAEGIDLPGERLVGAFIATLGLPQFNPINEQIRERMDAAFGAGYDYAYLYPGLQKVVQAAGRVIRTPSDRGIVYLIDDRFARSDVLALLPYWWKVERATQS
ncbi:MAG TPA: ATP-dependent DNA helicase [Noviherbaspirillum sp.]|nr:ATP-dependent DNA helicase [Noviherbaspirillum sp.]